MSNVFDYFKQRLNVAPDDPSLRELPLESNCGDDCKRAIDATVGFITCHTLAFGDKKGTDRAFRSQLIEQCERVVSTFWRG